MQRTRFMLFGLAAFSTVLAFLVVGLGAYTRLVHAGLGCPDWPGCYGFLTVPNTQQMLDWAQIQFPNNPVDPTKGWPEMIHRYAAGLLMLCVFILNLLFIKHKKQLYIPIKLGFSVLILITLQAVFGMWTVTLKLWPQVVTAHLMGGFITLSLLFLMSKKLYRTQATLPIRTTDLSFWLIMSIVIILLQIALGGWLSANYAALACPDFPQCQGHWLPAMNFKQGFNLLQSIGPDYLGGRLDSTARTAIHFVHRAGALLVLFSISMLCYSLYRSSRLLSKSIQKTANHSIFLLAGLLMIQIVLGVSNVLLDLPLHIALTHNLIGASLLLSLIGLTHCVGPRKSL